MGRVSDIHIEYQDMVANGELDEMPDEIIPRKFEIAGKEYKLNPLPREMVNRSVFDDPTMKYVAELISERNFYKERFKWERARVYKAWKDNPEVRSKLAYTRRWKK